MVPTVIESPEGVRSYLKTRAPRVFLDTNILIKGTSGKPHERTLIAGLCTEMDIAISDTVYWEFLRNTNIEHFRERRAALASWSGGGFLQEDRICREDEEVIAMHSRLFVLLLHANSRDPRHVLRLIAPDLWIAAACVSNRSDHILTTNSRDFPKTLFSPVACVSSRDCTVHLLAFRREDARQAWLDIDKTRQVIVDCNSFFPARKKRSR